MEAAAAVRSISAELRSRSFERECARLRPLGEAYVRRRFAGQLGDADAEDAVSEVLLRLHRQVVSGRAPENLQAAFFTGVRNASIDILRSRSARPTVGLEAVAEAPGEESSPFERAESAEDQIRLQEALGRMRGNYREAVVLRFGLGLTVPEIAEHLGISLPAAKKLVMRAAAQARERLESIDEHEFCAEMRDAARRAVFDREAAGVLDGEEAKVLHAHFRHCGSCRSFLAHLHEDLHELAGGVVVASGLGWHFGAVERLRGLAEGPGHAAAAVHERTRILGYRIGGAFSSSGEGPGTGALAGGAQKVAAICTAGVAGAATCLASGVVGPGIDLGAGPSPHPVPKPPAAKVRSIEPHESKGPTRRLLPAPSPVVGPPPVEEVSTAPSDGGAGPKRRGSALSQKPSSPKKSGADVERAKQKKESKAEVTEAEFGFESRAQTSTASGGEAVESKPSSSEASVTSEPVTSSPVPPPSSSSSSSSPSSSSSSSSSGSGGGSSGSEGTDFGGFEK